MTAWEHILTLIPAPGGDDISLDAFAATPLGTVLLPMKSTPQNPVWHAEGDVWTHTGMVCAALVADEAYGALTRREQEVVFLAALLHDIGKPSCTVMEDGVWRSPRHTIVGARMARECLWRDLQMSGTPEARSLREAVCTLIRYHGMPLHVAEREDPERMLIEVAAMGELTPDFSLKLLRLLVRADLTGRIGTDAAEQWERAELAFLSAEELGILMQPYAFPDPLTRHAYLSGRRVARDYPLYDDTTAEVILLAGLPGTGKDTWIREHYPDLPVISLDDIRRRLHIAPTDRDGQGVVAAQAKEQARTYLRQGQPFIWNATNLTRQTRGLLVELFEKYNARIRMVFLETDMETGLARNRARTHVVPEDVIDGMLRKLEPPTLLEAHTVEWITT